MSWFNWGKSKNPSESSDSRRENNDNRKSMSENDNRQQLFSSSTGNSNRAKGIKQPTRVTASTSRLQQRVQPEATSFTFTGSGKIQVDLAIILIIIA